MVRSLNGIRNSTSKVDPESKMLVQFQCKLHLSSSYLLYWKPSSVD